MATKIHPTAVIDPKAQLGENVDPPRDRFGAQHE